MHADSELAAQVMQRIAELGAISDEPRCLTRLYGSPAMRRANDLVARWMAEAGMSARLDAIGNLIGQASVIYQRDIKTTLNVGTVHTYSTDAASDPWTVLPAAGTAAALAELGTYWHNNFAGVSRSSVVMISRQSASASR